jgi:hypothetical protein
VTPFRRRPVQVGGQSMADRYTYVPLIGIFVAVAWDWQI